MRGDGVDKAVRSAPHAFSWPLADRQTFFWRWTLPLLMFWLPVSIFFGGKVMASAPVIVLLAVLPAVTRDEVVSVLRTNRVLHFALLAVPYAVVVVLLSPQPVYAGTIMLKALTIIGFSAANYSILARVPPWAWPRTTAALATGVGVLASALLLPLLKFDTFKVLYPFGHHYPVVFNRMIVLIALLSPVLMAIALRRLPGRQGLLGAALVFSATSVVSWLSVSETAKLLSVLAPLLLALSLYAPTFTAWLVGLGTTCLYLLFFPLANFVDRWLSRGATGISLEDYGSAWARIKFWVKAGERVSQNFWFGGGPNMMTVNRFGHLTDNLPEGQTSHPHSGIAQSWLDLGAVGVTLILASALAGLYGARSLSPLHRAVVITVLTLSLVVWAISHGMWQSWFHGLAGFCLTSCALLTVPSIETPSAREPSK